MVTAVYSDVGAVRKVNEDAYYISEFDENNNGFVIVADGMGGHNGGKTASKTAIDIIAGCIKTSDLKNLGGSQIESVLIKSIDDANSAVLGKALCDEKLSGMGTTVVICAVINQKAFIANVGDSRLYLVRNKEISQITKDHSVVQQLIDMGKITKSEAQHHPNKNLITRAVGSDIKTEADIYLCDLKKDDIILLCTDGLTNMVDDLMILDCINKNDDINEAVNILGKTANNNGGYDNITVIALKID